MNKFILLSALFAFISSVCAIPLPQDLTIAEFRSLRDEETPSQKVFISPSYAQVMNALFIFRSFQLKFVFIKEKYLYGMLLYCRYEGKEEILEREKFSVLKDHNQPEAALPLDGN